MLPRLTDEELTTEFDAIKAAQKPLLAATPKMQATPSDKSLEDEFLELQYNALTKQGQQAAPAPALATNAPAPASTPPPAPNAPPAGTSWIGRKAILPVVAGVDMAANVAESPLNAASKPLTKPSIFDTVVTTGTLQSDPSGVLLRMAQSFKNTPEGRNPIVNALLRPFTPDAIATLDQTARMEIGQRIRDSVGADARAVFKYEAGKKIEDPTSLPKLAKWADATLSQTLINLPQMAGAIVASKIPYVGHVAGIKMMGDLEANSYAQAWRAAGIDEDFMAPYAQAYGLGAGLVEYSQQLLFWGMTKKDKSGITLRPFAAKMKGVAAKIIKSPLGRALLGRFADAVSEGGEELSQGYLEYVISRKMAEDWNAQHPDRAVALPDWSGAEAWENFKAGASVGIAFGAVGSGKDIYQTVTDRSRYAAPIATATPEEIALGMPPDVAAEYRNAKTDEDKAKIVDWWNRKKMAAPPAPTTKPSLMDIQPQQQPQEGVIQNGLQGQGQEGQGPVAPTTPNTIEAAPAGPQRGAGTPPPASATPPAGPPIVNRGFTPETQQAELDRLNRKMRAVYRNEGIAVVAAEAPQDEAHTAAQAYVESRGRKVLWFRDGSGTVKATGTIGVSPDVVVLNADSTTIGRDVVEEEIAHDFSRRRENKPFVSGVVTLMKATDPEGYAEFNKAIRGTKEYAGMTQEAIDDEYFAKTFGYLMNNREFTDKMANVDRSAFRRMIDKIRDVIAGLLGTKQAVGQIDPSRMLDMGRYFGDITQLHDAMLEVYRRTAKTAAEQAEAAALQPAGVVQPYAGIGEPGGMEGKIDTDAALAVEAAPKRSNPVTQVEIDAVSKRTDVDDLAVQWFEDQRGVSDDYRSYGSRSRGYRDIGRFDDLSEREQREFVRWLRSRDSDTPLAVEAAPSAPELKKPAPRSTMKAEITDVEDFFSGGRKVIADMDEIRVTRERIVELAKGRDDVAKRAKEALRWIATTKEPGADTSDNRAKEWAQRFGMDPTADTIASASTNQMQDLADAINAYVEGRAVTQQEEDTAEEKRDIDEALYQMERDYAAQRKEPPPATLRAATPKMQRYLRDEFAKSVAAVGKSETSPLAEERDGKRVEFFEDAAGWHWRMGGEAKWHDVGTEINLRGQQRLVEAFTAFRDKAPEKYVAPKAEAVTEPDAIEPENAELPPESDELPFAAEANVTPEQDAAYLAAVERGDIDAAQRMIADAKQASEHSESPFIKDSDVVATYPSPLGVVSVMKYRAAQGRFKYFVSVEGKTRKSFYESSKTLGIDEALTSIADAKSTAQEFSDLSTRAKRILDLARTAPKNISVVTLPKAESEWERISKMYVYPQGDITKETTEVDPSWFTMRRTHGVAGGPWKTELSDKGRLAAFNAANNRNFTFAQMDRLSELEAAGSEGMPYRTQEDSELSGYDPNTAIAIVSNGRIIIAKRGIEMMSKYKELADKYIASDPITRDDAGNVILLSKRFNPEDDDIRFSAMSPSEAIAYSQTQEAQGTVEGRRQHALSEHQDRLRVERFPAKYYDVIPNIETRQQVRRFIGQFDNFRDAARAAWDAKIEDVEPSVSGQVIYRYIRALQIEAQNLDLEGDKGKEAAREFRDEAKDWMDKLVKRETLLGRGIQNVRDMYAGFGDPLFQERFFIKEVERANAPVMEEMGGDAAVEAAGKTAEEVPGKMADILEGKRKAEADAAEYKAQLEAQRRIAELLQRSLRAVERDVEERFAKVKIDDATAAELQQEAADDATMDDADEQILSAWFKSKQPIPEAEAMAAIDEPIAGMPEDVKVRLAGIARKIIIDDAAGKREKTKGELLTDFQNALAKKYGDAAMSDEVADVFDRVYAPTLADITMRVEAKKRQRAQQIADKRKKTIRRRKQADANQPALPEGEEVDVETMFGELRDMAQQRAASGRFTAEELAAYQLQVDEWFARVGYQEEIPTRPDGTQPTAMERRREVMRQLEIPQQAQDAIESLFAATTWNSAKAADIAAKLAPTVTETKPVTEMDAKRRREAAIRRRGLLSVMLKEGNVRIAELLRMPPEQRQALGRTLADQINATIPNLRPADAARIAVLVQTELTRLFNAAAKKRIEGMKATGKLKAETTRQKAYIRDVLQMVNMGIFNGNEAWKEKARDAFYKRYGLARMTPEIQAKLEEYAARIAKLPDGSTMQRDATYEAMHYMAAQMPYNWKDLTLPVIYSHLLSGFTTTAKNMLANIWSASDIILTDAERAVVQSVREKSFDPLRNYSDSLNLMWRAFRISAAEAGHIMRTGYSPIKDTKFSDEFRQLSPLEAMEAKTKAGKVAQAIWRFPRRLMILQDMLFWKSVEQQKRYLLTADLARRQNLSGKQLNDTVARIMGYTLSKQQREAYRAQARAEGNKGFVDVERRAWQLAEEASENDTTLPKWWRDNQTEVTADAVRAANEATFNQKNEGTIGLLTHHLGQAAAKTPTLRPLFMFTTVIGNVANRQIDYSPYALARIFRKGRHGGIKQQTGEVRQYSEYEDDTHRLRLINGFMLAASVAALAWKSAKDYEDDPEKDKKRPRFQIFGSGPSDPRVRKQVFDGKYAKRFSFRVGDGPAISYENTPFAGILAVVGRWMDWYTYERGKRPEDDTNKQVAFLAHKAFAEYMLQASPISYASTFLGALKENDANLSQRLMMYNVAGLTKYAIPNLLLQADQMRDPSKYQAEEWYEYFLRNIPIARSVYGRPALNIFGQPIKYGRASFITEKLSNDPVGMFLVSRKAWLPDPRLDSLMDVDEQGNRVKSAFTAAEKYEFSKVYGQTAYNQINREMAGMKFWTDDAVRNRISKICTVARKTAKNAVVNMRQQAHFKSLQLTD